MTDLRWQDHTEEAENYIDNNITSYEEILDDVKEIWRTSLENNRISSPEEYAEMLVEAIEHIQK